MVIKDYGYDGGNYYSLMVSAYLFTSINST